MKLDELFRTDYKCVYDLNVGEFVFLRYKPNRTQKAEHIRHNARISQIKKETGMKFRATTTTRDECERFENNPDFDKETAKIGTLIQRIG